MLNTMKTSDLTANILQYLRLRGAMAWRNNTGAMKTLKGYVKFGQPGSGDIFALYRGRFYSIEVKTGKDRVRDNQRDWIEAIQAHGGIAIVVRDVGDVVRMIP